MHININKKVPILAMEHPHERPALRVVSTFLIVLICAYLYFVASSVLNVIARQEALTQQDTLRGSIGILENQYFALTQTITPQAGFAMGLQTIEKPSYVSRPGAVGEANNNSHTI
jgi:hypothetical protein